MTNMTWSQGLGAPSPQRLRHVARSTSQRTAKRAQPVLRTPTKSYTLTEINGSEERNLLSSAHTAHSPPYHGAAPTSPSLASSLTSLPANIRDLFLPPGFPTTVTPDYLSYQLWSVPTHITGHLSHALVTSSLLAAVGVSAAPAATVALSASIKWIVKDGVGALGRLIVGSRFSAEFDEDPRRWRLVAELLSTVGLGLEVATCVYPQYFLMLATSGKFCQALGKGMGKPVFRVIQTHFARAQNVGAVAAKEEVWEVTAQMVGLAASVAVLRALEATGAADSIVSTWAAVQAVHVVLRYRALRTLLFSSLSLKRTAILASAWVRGRPVPSITETNAAEPIFTDPWDVRPRVRLGCSVAEAFGGTLPPPAVLQSYAEVYDGEGYMSVWRGGVAHVVLREGYTARDVLRAVCQAAWLDLHSDHEQADAAGSAATKLPGAAESSNSNLQSARGGSPKAAIGRTTADLAVEPSGGNSNGSAAGITNGQTGPGLDAGLRPGPIAGGPNAEAGGAKEGEEDGLFLLRSSLATLSAPQGGFESFLRECREARWEVDMVHTRVGRSRLRVAEAEAEA